jgi:DNA-binding NarL/FixJ family response regulator
MDALASADDFSAAAPEVDCVALLDLSMPGRDPLAVLSELRDTCPLCRVIVYSGYSDRQTVQEALAAGAWGLVDKITPPPEILGAIRRVAGGEAVFPRSAYGPAGGVPGVSAG